MKLADFSPEERLEIETAVVDAYTGPGGEVLTHIEAAERFESFLIDAVQAHRPWAQRLLDGFRHDGAARFAHDTWKHSKFFRFRHGEKSRTRTTKRGRQRVNEDTGQYEWIQDELFGWDAIALKNAIADAARQIDEHRANIAMYRHLLDLLEQTGATTVREGLQAVGMALEEYLEERAA